MHTIHIYMEYVKTTETRTVNNYPYGRLKCTAHFSLEFNPKRGFRSVFQTINPKTGRINKPKKSTYHDIMLMTDKDGFISYERIEFYDDKELNETCKLLSSQLDKFTLEQRKHIYQRLYLYCKLTVGSMVTYCNSDLSTVLELFKPTIQLAIKGIKDPSIDYLKDVSIDSEALEATEDKNYSPFKVTQMEIL